MADEHDVRADRRVAASTTAAYSSIPAPASSQGRSGATVSNPRARSSRDEVIPAPGSVIGAMHQCDGGHGQVIAHGSGVIALGTVTTMAFRGWPVEAIEFYEGLEADNSKVYWQDHKAVYERAVAGPMAELLAELAAEFGEGRIFRPYRDVRFSADKSPYKTAIAAELCHGGYIQLSSDGLAAGSGSYHMASDQLDRYRQAVADDRTGAALGLLVDAARQKRNRDHRPRVPEDGAKGLRQRPSSPRPAAPEGPGDLEAVAGGRLARNRPIEEAPGRVLPVVAAPQGLAGGQRGRVDPARLSPPVS